jgi:hypothetical protein
MALVKHFKELRVYQQAFEAASRIYKLSKRWPVEERYSLTDGLVKMMANPNAWCGPSQLCEPTATYDPHTPHPLTQTQARNEHANTRTNR